MILRDTCISIHTEHTAAVESTHVVFRMLDSQASPELEQKAEVGLPLLSIQGCRLSDKKNII